MKSGKLIDLLELAEEFYGTELDVMIETEEDILEIDRLTMGKLGIVLEINK